MTWPLVTQVETTGKLGMGVHGAIVELGRERIRSSFLEARQADGSQKPGQQPERSIQASRQYCLLLSVDGEEKFLVGKQGSEERWTVGGKNLAATCCFPQALGILYFSDPGPLQTLWNLDVWSPRTNGLKHLAHALDVECRFLSPTQVYELT